MIFIEDLTVYFEGSPHRMSSGGAQGVCHYTETDDLMLAASGVAQKGARAAVLFITTDFPNLKGGDAVTIETLDANGAVLATAQFSIYSDLRIQDGAISELWLKDYAGKK